MANITVSYEEMNQAAAELRAGHGEIARLLAHMKARIDQLLSAGFVTDQASGKFHEAYLRFTSAANVINDELQEMGFFLSATAQVLHDADAQIAARIQY